MGGEGDDQRAPDRGPALIAVAPEGQVAALACDAVAEGGGNLTADVAEASALIWCDPADADGLARAVHDRIQWVQLPWAGVEPLLGVIDDRRTWTSGKGVYAEPVAEHALALALAVARNLGGYHRARSWSGPAGRNVLGARVTVLGAGGITASLARLLEPFDVELTVVRRSGAPFAGASTTVTVDALDDDLADTDLLVLALALTEETSGIIGARRLRLLAPHAVVANVARGAHIVTEDLVEALAAKRIGGAGLDVTDPEPLPDDHPLWSFDNCIITPHVANTPEMARPLLARRIRENVRRWLVGQELLGQVDVGAGY